MLKTVNQSADYAKSNLLTRFFDGECEANGMIIDRFGKIRQTVQVTMHGYWAENAFKMDEVFTYQDGRVEERNWTVNFEDANNFLASTDDLDNPAIGTADANTVKMNYTFPVPIASRIYNLKFDDRMYYMNETTLYERATMNKFGIFLAEIVMVFHKKA